MSRRLERARSALPVTDAGIFLNTGSLGPISKTFSVTLRRSVQEDLRLGRTGTERFDAIDAASEKIRRELAGLVAADPAEIALTQSTSASLDAVIGQFPWEPGDEVVCTQLEHPACTIPLREQARRGRLQVSLASVPEDGADDLQWLEKCTTPRTRMIAFSGVCYTTGQRLPIGQIAEFARRQNIFTLLDGAQSVGALPLNLPELGIDFCAFPLQKWLLGPEGLGALYVRKGSIDDLRRDRVKQAWGVLEGTAAHLTWMRETLGWSWIHERTQTLAARARELLAGASRSRLLTPDRHAGLVTVEASASASHEIAEKLRRRRITVRSWSGSPRYRISTAFFNSEKEIAAFARLFR